MAIQNDDQFVVRRDDVDYKTPASELLTYVENNSSSSGINVDFPAAQTPVNHKWYYANDYTYGSYSPLHGQLVWYINPSSTSHGKSWIGTHNAKDAKDQTDVRDYANSRAVDVDADYIGFVYFQLVDTSTEQIIYGDAILPVYGCDPNNSNNSAPNTIRWFTGKSSLFTDFTTLMNMWDDKINKIVRWTMGPTDESTHQATGGAIPQWWCGDLYGFVHDTALEINGKTGNLGNTDKRTHFLPLP